MPNPIVPKYNFSTAQLTGPTTTQALSLTTGEIVTNIDQGDLYIKMRDGSIRNLTPVHSVNTASGLSLESSEIKALYNTQIASAVESVTVGGATSHPASYWQGKTVVEVLDAMLFPDLDPTYTVPTLSISGGVSGVQEVGSTITQNFTVEGRKNDAGIFDTLTIQKNGSPATTLGMTTASLTDIPDQYGQPNPNSPNQKYTTGLSTTSVTVAEGNTSWVGYATYDAGSAKNNNKGVTDTRPADVRTTSAPQAADSSGTFASGSLTVNGIYPYFYGKSTSATKPTAADLATAIAANTETKVVAVGSGTLSVTYNASGEYIWIAVPSSYPNKTKWYNTALNNGTIGAKQTFLDPTTANVNSPDGYWNGVGYKFYISDFKTTTSGALQFQE